MIRFAEYKDIEQIAKIHVTLMKKTYVGIWNQSYLDSLNIEAKIKQLQGIIKRDDRKIIVYEENEEILGFVICVFFSRFIGNGLCDVLYVRDDCQGRGIGKELVYAACEVLKSLGVSSMDIYCAKGNVKAENFYRKLGAVPDGYKVCTYTGEETISNRFYLKEIECYSSDLVVPSFSYDYDSLYPFLKEKFILFGAGNYCEAFMDQFGNTCIPKYIFDNNEKMQGKFINGVQITKAQRTDCKIILTSSDVSIRTQLEELGYCASDMVEYYPWHKYI